MTRVRSVAQLVARRVAAVLTLVTLVAALGITSIALIQRELADYRKQVTPLVDVTNNVRLTFTRSQLAYHSYLATGRPEYLPPYQEARQHLESARVRFDELAAPAVGPDSLARVRQTVAEWAQLADQGIRRRSQGQRIDLAPTTMLANAFHAELDGIERQVEHFRTERRAGYTGLIRLGLQLTVGATLLALVLGVWLAVQIIREVARPIRRLGEVVDAHAAGHQDARADPELGTREVRAVAGTFNALADDRQATIRRQARDLELREATEDLAGILAAVPSTDGGWSPACERLGSALAVDGVFVYSWSSDHDFVPLGGWTSPPKAHARLVVPQAVDAARQALTAPLTANDADGILAVFPETLAKAARREGITAWTLRPLAVGDHTVGVVSVWSSQPRRWAHEELDAVDRFAIYAARAVTEQRYIDTLRHLDAQKSNFLATTSHELRTPLTSMEGYLELLRDGELGPLTTEQAKACEVIDRHVTRLSLLIEDLLIINDLDSGRAGTVVATHDIDELLTRLRVRYAAEAQDRGVSLSVSDAPPNLQVRGDGEQLERAVAHVLANAIKFTPRGGTVTLTAEPSDDHGRGAVRLICTDTGIGIPAGDQHALFTRFFRASNATSEQIQGTGLGLTIAKAIIEAHGGSIEVVSSDGAGTTVRITLPRVTPQPSGSPIDSRIEGTADSATGSPADRATESPADRATGSTPVVPSAVTATGSHSP